MAFSFMAVFFWTAAVAQDTDYRAEAERLNYKVGFLLDQLAKASDTTYYYNTLRDVISTAVECADFDTKSNSRGKQKPAYLHHLRHKTADLREHLVDGGLYFYRHNRNDEALNLFDLYISSAASPLYADHPLNAGVYLFAARSAYEQKDYGRANDYADKALYEPDYARRAANIKVNCMRHTMTTAADSSKYVVALLALHAQDPADAEYMSLLMQYFMSPGHEEEMVQFANDEVRKYPDSKHVWEFKGEAEMLKGRWNDAVKAFQRAIRIDSLYVPAIYNIGICVSSDAQQQKDSLEKDHKYLKKDEVELLRGMFSRSAEYLFRARRLDPRQNVVAWAAPLYQVLFALNDKRMDEVKPLIKQ